MNAAALAETLAAWENLYIPVAKFMGLDIMRLAFGLPWDSVYTTMVYDVAKMDAVVNLLAQNGINSILDYHIGGGTVSTIFDARLQQSWIDIASHYMNNENVVAYEIYNEPRPDWESGLPKQEMLRKTAQAYHDITNAIRTVDTQHICIWEGPTYYIPDFSTILDLMLPNIVYTLHYWWTHNPEIDQYDSLALSNMALASLLNFKSQYNVPFWNGEFGGPGGGSASIPYSRTDKYWRICEELLYRCEENAIPWNLWMGRTTPSVARELNYYKVLFPLPTKK